MLHAMGLAHYEDGCDGGSGIMNVKAKKTDPNKPRPSLSADDRCALAILYCDWIVPVEEKISILTNTDIKVFPNPVSSVLNIELINDEKACIKSYYVVDIHGREVLSGLLPSASLHSINVPLNMSVLPNGTYFLLMTSSKREQIRSVKFEVYK